MKRLPVAITAAALIASACSGAGADGDQAATTAATVASTTTTTSVATTTTTSVATTTTTEALPVSPLRGEPWIEEDRQYLIAKISNAPKGRPQVGVDAADLVMEVLVEGGVPRFLAVFHSEYPETVGPLRSLREVDPKLIEPFDARVVSSGGQGSVLWAVREVAVDESHGRIAGYFRAPGRQYVYSLMLDVTRLPDLEYEGAPPGLLTFDAGTPEGDPAETVSIDQSALDRVGWEWDGARYLRLQDGVGHLDADDVQLSADTVVVLFVQQLSTGRRDAAGSIVPDYQVTGEGDAIVFRDGVAITGTWERSTTGDWFTVRNGAGDEIAMAPGRTWLHITPNGRNVTWGG